MSNAQMMFDIFAKDVNASKTFEQVGAKISGVTGGMKSALGGLTSPLALLSEGLAGGAGVAVKMAADFEKATTLLVTAGGESKANLGLVRDGILDIATSTGTSTQQLSEGMYILEKAGYKGADGLKVLKASAEGAKAENVGLSVMTQAVTDVMLDYGLKASDAVSVTNQMVTASGLAKTDMTDFANSMAAVIPVGSALGINFAELGGAIATMTQHGETAQQSSQNLANLIQNLAKPSSIASNAMQQMGIDVVDLTGHLGERGLSGTLQIVKDAIMAHMGPAGLVVQDTMKKSATATADLQAMLEKMPPALQKTAQQFLDGTMSFKDFAKEVKSMGGPDFAEGKQFYTLATQAKGFNDQIKGGSAEFQTYNAMLSKMTGGMTGLKASTMLMMNEGNEFHHNIEEIGKSAGETGDDIATWGETSQTAAVKLDQVKETIQTTAIMLGTQLLPTVKDAADGFRAFMGFMKENGNVARSLGETLLVIVGAFVAYKVATQLASAAQLLWGLGTAVVTGQQWSLNAALAANPIGAVILAITALGVAFVWAYNNLGWFKDGVDEAFRVVTEELGKVPGEISQFTSNTIGMFTDFNNNTKGMFDDFTSNTLGMFRDFFSNTIGMFVDFGNNTVGMLRDWGSNTRGMVQDAINGAVGFIAELPGRALAALSGMGSLLVGVGAQMMQGLINGVQGMIGNVTSAIQSGVASAVSGVKDFLGIHSPSRLLADEVGAPMGQGVIMGVRSTFGRLLDTMGDIRGLATSGVSPAGAGFSLAGGGIRPGLDLHGYSLKLNADATMATFERIADRSAQTSIDKVARDLGGRRI